MGLHLTETRLLERYARAVLDPPLMMLYPPVSTGRPYHGKPGARTLWGCSDEAGSLYVHVPFCATRCVFCPFYATVGRPSDYEGYVEAVLSEAALYADTAGRIEFSSVYLGGGSPSLFPPHLIERLLRGLGAVLRIDRADVTVEAHPANVNRTSAIDLCHAGVTRISLGVQSFDPGVLEACGRGETAAQIRPALEALLEAPLRDVNVDLMYGLPEQTMSSWFSDLRTATKLGVPSLTLYATVYLPAFEARCRALGYTMSTTQVRNEMYEQAYDFLCSAGYPQRHFGAGAFFRSDMNPHRVNVSYGLPTLGLGTWAYSSSGPFAYHNQFPRQDWAEWVERGRLPIRQLVLVPEPERPRKYVIEALLLAYVNLDHFRDTFAIEFEDVFPAELALLERLGLAQVEERELRLTRKGGRHLREIRYLFASEAVVEALETVGGQGL